MSQWHFSFFRTVNLQTYMYTNSFSMQMPYISNIQRTSVLSRENQQEQLVITQRVRIFNELHVYGELMVLYSILKQSTCRPPQLSQVLALSRLR